MCLLRRELGRADVTMNARSEEQFKIIEFNGVNLKYIWKDRVTTELIDKATTVF